MRIFAFEFFFFVVSVFAILVCISTAVLFAITYRFEKKLRTIWRALGFMLLAISCFFFILERKYLDVEIISVLIFAFAAVGLYSIFRGVRAEPLLSQLANIKEKANKKYQEFNFVKEFREPRNRNLLIIVFTILLVVGIVSVILTFFNLTVYVILALILLAFVFTLATMVIQVKRYLAQRKTIGIKCQNLCPLLGFVFLALALVSSFLHRLPESDLLFFRNMALDYSWVWHATIVFLALAFVFLGSWAWAYIKIRRLLKIFVVFLAAIIFVATLGSLIFNIFLFKIVEKNNLDLMEKGADTKELIMLDRSNVSMLIASLIAEDKEIISLIDGEDYNLLLKNTTDYLNKTNVDRIRIFNKYGEIVASPNDERDRGRVLTDDSLLAYAIKEKSPVKSYQVDSAVLVDILVVRSLYPVVENDEVKGVVEVGYVFDNAFADYIKSRTGLDVTIFVNDKRSATTIYTLDNVSRWAGSSETNKNVLEKVLKNGERLKIDTERLGVTYYNSYKPVKDVNGKIIGMVSVGIPTNILFEDARQQLLSIFLIISIIALLSAVFGAYVLYIKKTGKK